MTVDCVRSRAPGPHSSPRKLKAAVAAPPVDGKANAALIALLADSWRLPKSAFAIAKGTTSRTKKISIAGEPALIAERIVRWMESHG